jgi:hypothetical protein
MTTTETAKLAALNGLTKEVTAFPTWDDFRKAMEGGYVPTLRNRPTMTNASKYTRFREQAVTKLREMVRAEGFKVYDGEKVA